MKERTIYWIVGGGVLVLLIIMLAAWNYDRSNAEAEQKAQQLIAAFDQAGLRTPSNPDRIARVLGDDGGAVCATAGSDLARGILKLNLSVGGAFFIRPVKVDRRVLLGELLIIRTYCPERFQSFQRFVDDQDFDSVIRD